MTEIQEVIIIIDCSAFPTVEHPLNMYSVKNKVSVVGLLVRYL